MKKVFYEETLMYYLITFFLNQNYYKTIRKCYQWRYSSATKKMLSSHKKKHFKTPYIFGITNQHDFTNCYIPSLSMLFDIFRPICSTSPLYCKSKVREVSAIFDSLPTHFRTGWHYRRSCNGWSHRFPEHWQSRATPKPVSA